MRFPIELSMNIDHLVKIYNVKRQLNLCIFICPFQEISYRNLVKKKIGNAKNASSIRKKHSQSYPSNTHSMTCVVVSSIP